MLTLLSLSNVTFAQLSLDAQYRPRLEIRNGFKTPVLESASPAAFIEQRARLTAGYKSEKVGFKLSVQDVRIWGEVGQINKSDQLFSAHEAYGEYYASEHSTFRFGRQEVVYDGARYFGNLDWAMQGRSLDAARYIYTNEANQFEVLAAWNQTGFGDGAPEPAKLTGTTYSIATGGGSNNRIFNLGLPKAQFTAYYKRTLENGSVALMVSDDIFHPADGVKYGNITVGLTPDFKFGDFKVGGQFFYTGGQAGMDVDLSGFMANAYVQHTGILGSPLLGVDYLTGDDKSTTDKVEGWSPKYGTNHAFYGFMDYFYVGNGHGGGNEMSAGLMDIYLKTAFSVGKKTKVLGHLHYFASTAERTYTFTDNSSETYDGGLGTELDIVVVHNITPGIVLKGGYSQMFGISETMKVLKGMSPGQEIAGVQNWGWIMLAFNPKLL